MTEVVPMFGTTETVMLHTHLSYRASRRLIAAAGFAARRVFPMQPVLDEVQKCSRQGLPVVTVRRSNGSNS